MPDYNDFTEDLVITKVYALGYNVIRIISGLCSLAYPNWNKKLKYIKILINKIFHSILKKIRK